MKPSRMSDTELLVQIQSLVQREKEITLEILHLLREVEARELHFARGYSSLFDFCVKALGYSESATQRRI